MCPTVEVAVYLGEAVEYRIITKIIGGRSASQTDYKPSSAELETPVTSASASANDEGSSLRHKLLMPDRRYQRAHQSLKQYSGLLNQPTKKLQKVRLQNQRQA